MIDYEALGELQDWSCGWRSALDSGLSDTYVPGEGADNPIAMLIGEAPGAQEEIKFRPFVGKAGIVLRDLMTIAGLYAKPRGGTIPANCWLTNVVKFRPPRNRTPTKEEIELGRQGLNMEWRAIGKPTLIIPIGGTALQTVTRQKMSILNWAGQPHRHTSSHQAVATIWPMIHPSFVLRSNSEQLQRAVEKDWEKLGEWINGRQ